MKKVMVMITALFMVLSISSSAFAANAVSEMATTKGGQHVAECAQTMERGISHCAKMTECNKQ